MEIFGIGPLEIALIALVTFIVLGPDRIPGVMRQLGTWTRQLREMATNVTRDYNTEIREITGEITALQEEIRSIQRDLGGIATGLLTLPPEVPPPTRSNTAPPAEPIGPEQGAAKIQSMTDSIKRASPAAPAPQAAPPHAAPPPATSADAPATASGHQSESIDSFEI
jgi:sec-independent protein translocase protein TatB